MFLLSFHLVNNESEAKRCFYLVLQPYLSTQDLVGSRPVTFHPLRHQWFSCLKASIAQFDDEGETNSFIFSDAKAAGHMNQTAKRLGWYIPEADIAYRPKNLRW